MLGTLVVTEFLENMEKSFFGAAAVPVLVATLGVFLVLVITGFLTRLLRKNIELPDAAKQSKQPLNHLLRQESVFLAKLLVWIRWMSVVLIVSVAVTMLFENTSLLLLQSGHLKNVALTLQKASDRLDDCIKNSSRAFWSVVFLVCSFRVIENTLQAVISKYVSSANEQRALGRVQTLHVMSGYFLRTVMAIVILLTVMQIFGFNTAPLLATAGVASVAFGFGAQSFVKDVLAGFFILLEDQFAVGDVIAIDDKVGKVESMTLRITRLRAADGQIIVIPNSEIRSVRNSTSGWTQFEFQISISYSADVDNALRVLNSEIEKIGVEKAGVMMPTADVSGVSKLANESVILRAYVRVLPERKWELEREVNRRVLARFKAENIVLASPHLNVKVV